VRLDVFLTASPATSVNLRTTGVDLGINESRLAAVKSIFPGPVQVNAEPSALSYKWIVPPPVSVYHDVKINFLYRQVFVEKSSE